MNCQLPVAGGDIQSSVCYYPLFYYILTNLTINNCSVLLQQDETIEVVDNNKMLLVDFQAQVSGDVGLNDIPIKVATTTVRDLSTACRWGGHTLFCLL